MVNGTNLYNLNKIKLTWLNCFLCIFNAKSLLAKESRNSLC